MKKHGGKRKGAGRPPGEPTTKVRVSITVSKLAAKDAAKKDISLTAWWGQAGLAYLGAPRATFRKRR